MSESEKPFTVSDRRHFTPDGRPRDAAEHDSGAEPVSPSPAHDAAPSTPTPDGATAAPAPGGAAPRGPAPGAPAGAGEADFAQFLLSLGAQAGLFLSEEGRPEDMEASEALAGARSIISILEMLRTKTEGRRTPDENQVLEGLLYELRMAYVEASRASGS